RRTCQDLLHVIGSRDGCLPPGQSLQNTLDRRANDPVSVELVIHLVLLGRVSGGRFPPTPRTLRYRPPAVKSGPDNRYGLVCPLGPWAKLGGRPVGPPPGLRE